MNELRDDEARLAGRLASVDQIEVPDGDLDRLRRRVQRGRRRRAVVASCAVASVLAVGVAAATNSAGPATDYGVSASDPAPITTEGPDGTTTTTDLVATSQPVEGASFNDLPLDSPVATSVARLLPGQPAVRSVVETRLAATPAAGNVRVSAVHEGTGYEVTIFRAFAVSELTRGGSPEVDVAGGRAWIGSLTSGRITLYFLNDSTGVGVRITRLGPRPGEATDELEALGATALAVSADPTVVQVARER